jgi:hypothetical protein
MRKMAGRVVRRPERGKPFETSAQRAVLLVGALCAAFAVAPPSGAQPALTNDLCSGAVAIPSSGPFPYLTPLIADVSAATTNSDPALSGDCSGLSTNASRSLWFTFRPAATAEYGFSVGADTATTLDDTILGIYVSTSGTCAGPFAQITCNDDSGSPRSALFVNMLANTTYYLVVWRWGSDDETLPADQTALQMRVSRLTPPPNDNCAGAITIPGTGPFPYLAVTNDTAKATDNAADPLPECEVEFYRSVWFRFTPVETTTYSFSTGTETATTIDDTTIGIYTSEGACSGPFTEVGCAGFLAGVRAVLNLELTAATTYYIVVWDYEADPIPGETLLQLRVAKLAKPGAATLPANSLISTSAVLRALVNPNVALTRYWFEWGATTNYGNSTPRFTLPVGSLDVPINQTLIGLTPGATYHFRSVATNIAGTTFGTNQTFAWRNTRPVIFSYRPVPGGNFRIEFTGVSPQIYRVEASSDLMMWETEGDATDQGNGTFLFEDPGSNIWPHRLYRIVAP